LRRALALAVTVAALAGACSFPGAAGGDLTLTATFDDVGDLVSRHSVQMADVRVGSVTGIELTDDFKAKVTLSIKSGMEIPRKSTALLRTTSLLGEKFIELRPEGDPTKGPFFHDNDVIKEVDEAPELEFVAEQAIQVLGGIAANDLATLGETGAQAFGGRTVELRGLIDDLSVISGTLADQTGNIVKIIDGLDSASQQLAASDGDIDSLLGNLSQTTELLAQNRQKAIDALAELTRLAKVQNDTVLRPFRDDIDRQIKQVDVIVGEVAAARAEVGNLIDWVDRFVTVLPQGVPNDFAQVYSWFVNGLDDDRIGAGK
jgi:phospholipid/cholesterol/gamma-HCH transport system substrate-binding protein